MRSLAARFVLLGVTGPHVVVRRKADGAVGTLRYAQQPLRFSDFRASTRPEHRGPRP